MPDETKREVRADYTVERTARQQLIATRLILWLLATAAIVVLVALVLVPAVNKSDDYNACRDRVVETGRYDPACD